MQRTEGSVSRPTRHRKAVAAPIGEHGGYQGHVGGPSSRQIGRTNAIIKTGSVARLQQHLRAAGYDIAVDGVYGPRTAAALKSYSGAIAHASQARQVQRVQRGLGASSDIANVVGRTLGDVGWRPIRHPFFKPIAPYVKDVSKGGYRPPSTPIVTEHTRGQVRGAPVYRGGRYILPQTGEQGGLLKPGEINFTKLAKSYIPLAKLAARDAAIVGAVPATVAAAPFLATAAGVAAATGHGHALIHSPASRLLQGQVKQAGVGNVGVAKGLYQAGLHDVHHPYSAQTFLDVAGLLSGGYEGALRGATALSAVRGATTGERVAAAARALREPAQLEQVPGVRRVVGHPETGTRNIRYRGVHVQPWRQSQSALTQTFQHLADRGSELVPEVPLIGAKARVGRNLLEQNPMEQRRILAALGHHDVAVAAKSLGTKIPGKVTAREMAHAVIQKWGHTGDEGVALLNKDIATKKQLLAELGPDHPKYAKLADRISLLEASRKYVQNPDAAIMRALKATGSADIKATQSAIDRGAFTKETADQAANRHIRFLHGANWVEPTSLRLGEVTAKNQAALDQLAELEREAEAARAQVAKMDFGREGRKRLGLKSQKLVARQEQLAARIATLKKELKGAGETAPAVHVPTPRDMSGWHRHNVELVSVDDLLPLRDAVDTTTPEKISALAAKLKTEGMEEPIILDHAADGRTYVSEGNNRLLAAKEAGFTHVPVRVLEVQNVHPRHGGEFFPAEYKGQHAKPSDIGLQTHKAGRTAEEIQAELGALAKEHGKLSKLTTELPVGMPDVADLRARLAVEEKKLRALEAKWNAPAAALVEERKTVNRLRRAGSGAQKEIQGAIGGSAEEHLGLTGREALDAREADLKAQINELRGKASKNLQKQYDLVKGLRNELRTATTKRAHIVEDAGNFPHALTAKGEKVTPKGTKRLENALAAQSRQAARVQKFERRRVAGVGPTGLVTPEEQALVRATRVRDRLQQRVDKATGTPREAKMKTALADAQRTVDDLTKTVAEQPREQGPFGHYAPDVTNKARNWRQPFRSTSLNPVQERIHASRGILEAQGRNVPGPRATLAQINREARIQHRALKAERAVGGSVPFDANTFDPRKHELVDPHVAKTAEELQAELGHGAKSKIAAAKRDALDLPMQLHADDMTKPGAIMNAIAEEYKAWEQRLFPSYENVKGQDLGHLKMIDKKFAKQIRGFDARENGDLMKILNFWNQANRVGLIYLNTSYIPVQFTGNVGYNLIQHAFNPGAIYHNVRTLNALEDPIRRRVTEEVGGGLASYSAHEGRGAGHVFQKVADFQNAGADKLPRDVAWMEEARRMGFDTPEKVTELVTSNDPALRRKLNVVSERAQQAMVKFERAPTGLRKAISSAIFIAPWLEGSTRWIGRTIADRPFTAALANRVRDHVIAQQQKVLKEGKMVSGGFIPIDKLPGGVKLPFAPRGKDLIPGFNPDAISPTGSGVGVAKALGEAAGLYGSPVHGRTRALAALQPVISSAAAAGFRIDPYSGISYPAKTPPWKIFLDQQFGTVQHPAFPAVATIETALRGAGKDVSKKKPVKQPVMQPEHGWQAALERAAMGSIRPRSERAPAIAARSAKIIKANASPAEKRKILAQQAIEGGRRRHNAYTAAAIKYGAIPADGQLPDTIKEALHRKTTLKVNNAKLGLNAPHAPQGIKYAAEIKLAQRLGWLDPQIAAAQLAWLATNPASSDIRSRRSKLEYWRFGGQTLSLASKALKKRKRAQEGGG